ncbi:invasion associated locus B family protein [Pseudoroseicyclus aestuarii]|uniref:Invasion protein IalB n=1 Tax=Pseudoroseicyclus aestuarii TaxID=1795041 RepID=A0A318T013_9RHOB|nr:invasion associated locus B family protein [Pseudoroseicyclus aestuarii]PYE86036.1 invasion protein IalB [Pseudoroseicyclus aestuarii]
MLKQLKPLTLAAILGALPLAGPALAQEAEADAAGQETGAASEDTAGQDALDLGTAQADPAAAADAPGQPYIRDEFDDWSQRCLRAPEGEAEPCQLYQLLLDGEENAVAEISILPLEEGNQAAAGVVVVVPLETQLTEQLTLQIGTNEARQYPYEFCNQAGCVSRFGLSDEQLTQFRRGASGTVRIVPAAAPDQEVTLDMSLAGFTAGFDAISEGE